MTLDEIDQIFSLVTAWYPHSPLTPDTEVLWTTALAHAPGPLVKTRLETYLVDAEHRYPPLLSDLLTGSSPDQGEWAWLQVTDAIQRLGAYQQPQWKDDPLIAAAVKACGGWQALCWSSNLPADRAHFLRYYAAYQHRALQSQWNPVFQSLLPSRKEMLDPHAESTPHLSS